jgi:hypothetical protein
MGRGREDSTIDGLVLLRGRHGTGQAGQQRERIHVERVGAIRNHRAIHMIGSVEFIMRR